MLFFLYDGDAERSYLRTLNEAKKNTNDAVRVDVNCLMYSVAMKWSC